MIFFLRHSPQILPKIHAFFQRSLLETSRKEKRTNAAKPFRLHIQTIFLLIFLIFSVSGGRAEPRRLDLYGLLKNTSEEKKATPRTKQGRPLAETKNLQNPRKIWQKESLSPSQIRAYQKALGIEEKLPKKRKGRLRFLPAQVGHALRLYLSAMKVPCPATARSESALLRCLSYKASKAQSSLERLALWQAAKLSERYGLVRLQKTLLEKNEYLLDDPLNRRILTLRLQALAKSNLRGEQKSKAALLYPNISSAMVELWRGRILAKAGEKERAFLHFLKAARHTRAYWIERAILTELRRHYPALLSKQAWSSTRKKRLRELTAFSPQMKPQEIASLKRALPAKKILATTNSLRLRRDGLFLIASKQARHLPTLANRGYTELSQKPEILLDWARILDNKKQWSVLKNLLKEFPHTFLRKRALWLIYLDVLENSGSKQAYFNEIIRYLNKFPSDYDTQDRLIAFLLGKNPDQYHWAARTWWRKAHEKLPRHTGSGRFIYWLFRYFEAHNDPIGLRRLRAHFYSQAPGSFYAGAFWDAARKDPVLSRRNFLRDWQKVKNRKDYLHWISLHGDKEAAIRFLSRRRPLPYLDAKALRAERKLREERTEIPEGLLLLYQFKHFQVANETLRFLFPDASDKERFLRLSWIGRKSKNLNYSVYYTRAYIRKLGISEDPFGMPPRLLSKLYPRPYFSKVKQYSRRYGIEADAVYAIMHQESLFRKDAISRSGARGLMQIMPRTGRWLASKMRIRNYNLANLSHPDTNIQMGTKFFSDLIRSTGDFRWAAIAYNGGPGNLRKWKRKYYKGDLYHFLEHLPKAESRNYCRITYQNYMHYRTTRLLYPYY